MNQVDNTDQWSDPVFFKVIRHQKLPAFIVNQSCVILRFKQQELADPEGDLVGIAYWAGRRRYLWNNSWWSEYPLESHIAVQKIKAKMKTIPLWEYEYLIDILELIHRYEISPPPEAIYKNPHSQHNQLSKTIPKIYNAFLRSARKDKNPEIITRVIYPVVR